MHGLSDSNPNLAINVEKVKKTKINKLNDLNNNLNILTQKLKNKI